jgi:hypothetical protein
MSNTITYLRSKRAAGGIVTKVFSVTVSGSYTQSSGIGTPGETLAMNSAAVSGKPARPKIPSTLNGSTSSLIANNAIRVSRNPDGYEGLVEQNASSPTAQNYVLRIFTNGNAELGSGTYPANLSGDTTGFIVEFDVSLKYD